MEYTFQISDISAQSQSIINLLLSLAKDYDFIKVIEEGELQLTSDQEEELDRRYEMFLKNPKNGKPWKEVKKNLMQI